MSFHFPNNTQLESYMHRALELASMAMQAEEVPIGAVLVKDGRIIGEGKNGVEANHDASSHAELIAIREGSKSLSSWRLDGCLLVSTLEPCLMCAGLILQSRVSGLVYAASDPEGGGFSTFFDASAEANKPKVMGGFLEAESSQLLKTFFSRKR